MNPRLGAASRPFVQDHVARFAGSDPHYLVAGGNEYLSIADLTCPSRAADRLDHCIQLIVENRHLELDLGKKIHHIFCTPVLLGMTLLTSKAFDLNDGEAADTETGQGFSNNILLKRLDYSGYKCH